MYRLELYDNVNTDKVGILLSIDDARVVEGLEGENSLSFDLDFSDELFSTIIERQYIRVVNRIDPTDYKSFIIQEITINKDSDNQVKAVSCEGLKYALMDDQVVKKKEYSNITASTALSLLLADSAFSAGTVDPSSSNLQSILFNWPNALEGLEQIVDTWFFDDGGVRKKYYYRVNENLTIDIRSLANLGTEKKFYIQMDKNLNSLVKNSDVKDMQNRTYGVGEDGFSMVRAGKNDYELSIRQTEGIDDIAATYLEDDDYLIADDRYNGLGMATYQFSPFDGDFRIISDTDGTLNRITPTVNFTDLAVTNYALGILLDGVSYTYELGEGVDTNTALRDSVITIETEVSGGTNPGALDGTASLRIEGLDASNNTVFDVQQSIYFADLSALRTGPLNFDIQVGDANTIRKLRFTPAFTANFTGTTYISLDILRYSLANNAYYVEDTDSQDTGGPNGTGYGVVSGKYENPNIQDTINLVATPSLDGTYTTGLCENWTAVGSPTLAENTDADFFTQGTKSQKVTATAEGEGTKQEVSIPKDQSLSAFVRIYIDNTNEGSVEVLISPVDGTEDDTFLITSGVGSIDVVIENFSYSDTNTVEISVLSSGGNTIFYVDAIMIHTGTEIHTYVDGDSADMLYTETENYMKQHKDPIVSYDIDMVDLAKLLPAEYAEEDFEAGDQVRIVDSDLSIDDVFLVANKQYPIDNPADASLRLQNKVDNFQRGLGVAILKMINQQRVI